MIIDISSVYDSKMVQGEKYSFIMSANNNSSNGINNDTKKASYEATKEKPKTDSWSSSNKSTTNGQANGQAKNYGSWGPIYKNKANFTDMHLC